MNLQEHCQQIENLRFRKTSYRHRCSFENGENRSQLLKLEQNRGRDQT